LQGLGVATPHDRGHTLSGLVEADLHLAGTLGAPRLALLVNAEDGRLDDTPIGRGELAVRYADRRPEATLLLSTIKGGNIRLSMASAVDLSYPRVLRPIDVQALPLTADLQAKDFDLAIFSGLAEPVHTVGGRLDASARVRGHVGTPQFDGRIEWRQGRLVLAGLGSYQNVHLLFHGNNDEMVLEDLSADSRTGKAKLSARAARSSGNELKFSTKIDLRSFAIYSAGQPAATLQLRGGATGVVSLAQVNVAAQIEEAHVVLPAKPPKKLQALDRPPDVVLMANGRPIDREQAKKLRALVVHAPELTTKESAALPPPAPAAPPRPVRVEIDAPRNLWIEGPDVHAEVGLGQNFFVTLTEGLRVFGTVYVRRGRVDALGKRFDLDSTSTVQFTGRPEVPLLSASAKHQARKAGITIAVKIDGPANGPSITLSSPDNPQLGDTELLTVLATGHLPEERGGTSATPSNRAASLLGSVVASQLQKAVAKRLPLDVLTIEPGEGLSGTRLEAGTYLTDDVYVAYVGRIGADPLKHENSNEFQLEYQLTRRWSFEGTYGDARSGSADLVWTKHY
jgi:translocation and assembly module TamB